MEIAKYFGRISKKRDLSNNSSDQEASKKLREGSLDYSAVSDISANNEDPFSKCSRRQRIAKLKANVN